MASPASWSAPLGIRDYSSDSGATAVGEQPESSLPPEVPQLGVKVTGSESELPVVALRVSDSWEVVILVPQSIPANVELDS
jgi:hypothetical protein